MTATASTGTRDLVYDLISVAYHALQGVQTYGVYAQDAQESGDDTCREFFTRAQETNRQIADEAKQHLVTLVGKGNKSS
jgi:hypothetical protein